MRTPPVPVQPRLSAAQTGRRLPYFHARPKRLPTSTQKQDPAAHCRSDPPRVRRSRLPTAAEQGGAWEAPPAPLRPALPRRGARLQFPHIANCYRQEPTPKTKIVRALSCFARAVDDWQRLRTPGTPRRWSGHVQCAEEQPIEWGFQPGTFFTCEIRDNDTTITVKCKLDLTM